MGICVNLDRLKTEWLHGTLLAVLHLTCLPGSVADFAVKCLLVAFIVINYSVYYDPNLMDWDSTLASMPR